MEIKHVKGGNPYSVKLRNDFKKYYHTQDEGDVRIHSTVIILRLVFGYEDERLLK